MALSRNKGIGDLLGVFSASSCPSVKGHLGRKEKELFGVASHEMPPNRIQMSFVQNREQLRDYSQKRNQFATALIFHLSQFQRRIHPRLLYQKFNFPFTIKILPLLHNVLFTLFFIFLFPFSFVSFDFFSSFTFFLGSYIFFIYFYFFILILLFLLSSFCLVSIYISHSFPIFLFISSVYFSFFVLSFLPFLLFPSTFFFCWFLPFCFVLSTIFYCFCFFLSFITTFLFYFFSLFSFVYLFSIEKFNSILQRSNFN